MEETTKPTSDNYVSYSKMIIKELEDDIKNLESEMDKKNKLISELKCANRGLATQIIELDEQLSKENTNKNNEEMISILQKKLDTYNRLETELRSIIKNMEIDQTELTKKNLELTNELNTCVADNIETKRNNEQIIVEKEHIIVEKNNEIETLKSENNRIHSALTNLINETLTIRSKVKKEVYQNIDRMTLNNFNEDKIKDAVKCILTDFACFKMKCWMGVGTSAQVQAVEVENECLTMGLDTMIKQLKSYNFICSSEEASHMKQKKIDSLFSESTVEINRKRAHDENDLTTDYNKDIKTRLRKRSRPIVKEEDAYNNDEKETEYDSLDDAFTSSNEENECQDDDEEDENDCQDDDEDECQDDDDEMTDETESEDDEKKDLRYFLIDLLNEYPNKWIPSDSLKTMCIENGISTRGITTILRNIANKKQILKDKNMYTKIPKVYQNVYNGRIKNRRCYQINKQYKK